MNLLKQKQFQSTCVILTQCFCYKPQTIYEAKTSPKMSKYVDEYNLKVWKVISEYNILFKVRFISNM